MKIKHSVPFFSAIQPSEVLDPDTVSWIIGLSGAGAYLSYQSKSFFWLSICVMLAALIVIVRFLKRRKSAQADVPPPDHATNPPAPLSTEEIDNLKTTWRRLLSDEKLTWVLFEYGTCVVVPDVTENKNSIALKLLKEFGPATVGTSAADFTVNYLEDDPGCVVTYYHPNILNYLPFSVVTLAETTAHKDALLGNFGRNARHLDAKTLKVVHVESI